MNKHERGKRARMKLKLLLSIFLLHQFIYERILNVQTSTFTDLHPRSPFHADYHHFLPLFHWLPIRRTLSRTIINWTIRMLTPLHDPMKTWQKRSGIINCIINELCYNFKGASNDALRALIIETNNFQTKRPNNG